jgi:PKD repeat protein
MRASAGSATLAWNAVTSPALAGYMLHYGPSAGNYTSRIDVGNATSRIVSSLTEGATYHFVVTAYDASHVESAFSNDVTVNVPYAAPVANFTASTTSGAVPLALNFVSTSTGSISSYQWAFGDGGTSSVANPSHVYAAAGTYTVSLTVKGPGGSNTKIVASAVRVTSSADATTPSAPGSLVASTGGTGAINLAWKASTDNVGVTGYRIERCQGSGCTAFAQIGTASATGFASTGLAAGTTYTYRVRASDAAGNLSAYSNVASATTSSSSSGTTTSTRLTATPSTSFAGNAVAFSAAVTGHLPTGTVRFTDNGTTIAGCGAVVLSTVSRAANCVTSALAAGTHTIVATYSGDNANAASTSPSASQIVKAVGGSINVALAANGGVASASSTLRAANAVGYVNDNRRSGAGWTTGGGGWSDATSGQFPDWVQINFSGQKTIDHVVVYSLQDDLLHPLEPTATMTFTRYGIKAFDVQGWNGASWVTLGSVTGNNLVKRTVTFAPFRTDRIRVVVKGVADNTYSRIAEIEAWTAAGTPAVANYALSLNGGVAAASTMLRTGFEPRYVNDNHRTGAGFMTGGGGWNDGTSGQFPDALQITLPAPRRLDHVVVYSVQDNYQYPVEPTATMTFTRYGLTAFDVQAFNGVQWVTLASVTGNSLVKRSVAFSPFTTDRIRILVKAAADHTWSRVTEFEAWGQ